MYIALFYPSIRYDGDKTVPEEDVIHYEKITFRDLRLDEFDVQIFCQQRRNKTYRRRLVNAALVFEK